MLIENPDLCWCSLMLVNVRWCSLMFVHVCWCSMMLIDDHWCSLMFLDVHCCSLMFLHVCWCSMMLIDDHWSSLMFLDVHWCSLMFSNKRYIRFIRQWGLAPKFAKFGGNKREFSSVGIVGISIFRDKMSELVVNRFVPNRGSDCDATMMVGK